MANLTWAGKKGTNDLYNDISTIMNAPVANGTIEFGTFVKYETVGGADNKIVQYDGSGTVLGVAEATSGASDLDNKKYSEKDYVNVIRENELYLVVDPGATVAINRDSKLGVTATGKLVNATDTLKAVDIEGRSSTIVTPTEAAAGATALVYFKLIK